MGEPSRKLRLLESAGAADGQSDKPRSERDWLAVSEVGARLQVPDRRLRRYLDRHAALVRTRRTGRRTLVSGDSLPVLARIRELYAEGATARDIDKALADKQPAGAPSRKREARALTAAMLAAASEQQIGTLRDELGTLRGKLAEMGAALEQRDRVLRRALMAMVDLFQYYENERHLAETERDRDNAHHHQRVMLALQELLMHSRKRRRWW
ncbi:MAG: MerR family transcriptional regulator [Alphaproteobacteria bacterium]